MDEVEERSAQEFRLGVTKNAGECGIEAGEVTRVVRCADKVPRQAEHSIESLTHAGTRRGPDTEHEDERDDGEAGPADAPRQPGDGTAHPDSADVDAPLLARIGEHRRRRVVRWR